MTRVRVSLAAAGVMAALGVAPSAAGAHRLPKLPARYPNAKVASVRPEVVNYSNDGSGAFGGANGSNGVTDPGSLRWSSWTAKRAVGHGVDWVKICHLGCGDGRWVKYRARLIASDPRGAVFRKLVAHEVRHGTHLTLRFRAVRVGRSWEW